MVKGETRGHCQLADGEQDREENTSEEVPDRFEVGVSHPSGQRLSSGPQLSRAWQVEGIWSFQREFSSSAHEKEWKAVQPALSYSCRGSGPPLCGWTAVLSQFSYAPLVLPGEGVPWTFAVFTASSASF